MKARRHGRSADSHRGGQELPDELQDRPEQNAGYDEAVRRGPAAPTVDDADVDRLPSESGADLSVREVDLSERPDDLDDPDNAAARDAAAEVRRRDRSR